MIIIAGTLRVAPEDRQRYLAEAQETTVHARRAPGCLDFVQAADPVEPDRIHVYERWESDEDQFRFREADGTRPDLPPLRSAEVQKYRVGAVEAP